RINRGAVIVLHGEHIDFSNALYATEIDLQPIRIGACSRIIPPAPCRPAQAFTIAVVSPCSGESAVIRTGGARNSTVCLGRCVNRATACPATTPGFYFDDARVSGKRRVD